ncbi:MAG: PKD domain-containing protein [Bacteroidia bacterium]|nr:PKD domain-containing protein [Bacteroidia bacterium]
MLKPIPIPNPPLTVREPIVSGVIERKDGNSAYRSYGIIFTTSPGHAESDYSTDELLGSVIEHLGLPPEETDRYFTILGGYYAEKFIDSSGKRVSRVRKVFGVARDASKGFDIRENSGREAADDWRLTRSSKPPRWDEKRPNQPWTEDRVRSAFTSDFNQAEFGQEETYGWTFIVDELKTPDKTPCDAVELGLRLKCPDVSLSYTVQNETETHLELLFTADIQGPAPTGFEWEWGPGELETSPDNPIAHTFEKPLSADETRLVRLRLSGPFSCLVEAEASVPLPARCPAAEAIQAELLSETPLEMVWQFTAEYDGPEPADIQWQFGDGTTAAGLTATHAYARTPGADTPYTVQVLLAGPGNCQSSQSTQIVVGRSCPVAAGLSAVQTALSGDSVTFQFTAEWQHVAPASWRWQIGELLLDETAAVITYTFPRPAGDAVTQTVTAQGEGPGECGLTAPVSAEVQIPGVCPVLDAVTAVPGEALEDSLPVQFTAEYSGPAPAFTRWTYGELTVETADPVWNFSFPLPVGDPASAQVQAVGVGPGSCLTTPVSVTVLLPARCPLLTAVEALAGAQTESEVAYTFTAAYAGPAPSSIAWTVDGQPAGDGTAVLNQAFAILPGDPRAVEVGVTISGPGSCAAQTQTVRVTVPGICPVLTAVEIESVTAGEPLADFVFKAETAGVLPARFRWTIGTETIETTDPRLYRSFSRPLGDPVTIQVSVQGFGPDACSTAVLAVMATIPGICPVITGLTSVMLPEAPLSQTVRFTVETEKASPASYTWNWGDGSPEQMTTGPLAEHEFARQPGDPASRKVTVTANGPGSCASTAETYVTIPGLCPEVTAFTLENGPSDDFIQQIAATLVLAKTPGTHYHWNWGDGSPVEMTTSPQAGHGYARLPGDARSYPVSVRIEGPGSCTTLANGMVSIPGVCPVIESLAAVYGTVESDRVLVTVTAAVTKAQAQSYEWDWGDGSPVTTTYQPSAQHLYMRQPGDARDYPVQVRAAGPGSCMSSAAASVQIPGICPEITAAAQHTLQLLDTGLEQAFSLEVAKTPALRYRWEWGDGTDALETTEPAATHRFARTPGEDATRLVRVQALGPGSCNSQIAIQVLVPMICPVVTSIDIQHAPPLPAEQPVTVAVSMSFGPAGSVHWNWGDGVIETTASPQATHVYRRLPGDDKVYEVSARITGPGMCECPVYLRIQVPGICPQVLSMETLMEPSTDYRLQPVRARIETDYPEGIAYLWDWNDGSAPVTTSTPELVHVYARHPGDPRTYTLAVTLQGPERCTCTAATPVVIAGYCPEVLGHEVTVQHLGEESLEAVAALTLDKGYPDQIAWDWGDGSEPSVMTGGINSAAHTYTRLPGNPRTYTVVARLYGPGTACSTEHSFTFHVPGICPAIGSIQALRAELIGETAQEVALEAAILRTPAESYTWSWGDGSPATVTTVPFASHTYPLLPGDPLAYEIRLTAEGPGDCRAESVYLHTVPGLCPRLEQIELTPDDLEETTQTIHATLQLALASGTAYHWNWGDGSEPETTEDPVHSHVYQRLPGDARPYTLHVSVEGPGSCAVSGTADVLIPGRCPELTGIDFAFVRTSLESLHVQATLTTGEILPERVRWNWGDGSAPEETEGLTHAHDYQRFPGDARIYQLTVETFGPGTSGACNQTLSAPVTVPGYCPELTGMELITDPLPDEKTQTVLARAQVQRAAAEQYRWDWGDGSEPETTAVPEASHAYQRLAGPPRTVQITVTALGPDSCSASFSGQAEILGTCPKILGRTVTRLGEDSEQVQVQVMLEIEDLDLIPAGMIQYHWTWGDGSTETTTAPSATHAFRREGQDRAFMVEYRLEGAGGCGREGCVRVPVEGYCPVLTEIDPGLCSLEAGYADFSFTARFRTHPEPESWPSRYIWRWGDGTPDLITDSPYGGHRFVRNPEQMMVYQVEVIAQGGPCGCKTRVSQAVEVPGNCPLITDIEVVYGPADDEWQEVTLISVIRAGVPGRFEWDPGDGSGIQAGQAAWIRHRYRRSSGRYLARLTVRGVAGIYLNSGCEHTRERTVEIPVQIPVQAD